MRGRQGNTRPIIAATLALSSGILAVIVASEPNMNPIIPLLIFAVCAGAAMVIGRRRQR
jgi:ABC-type uncharacterized transport system YnjBCD permease subunit